MSACLDLGGSQMVGLDGPLHTAIPPCVAVVLDGEPSGSIQQLPALRDDRLVGTGVCLPLLPGQEHDVGLAVDLHLGFTAPTDSLPLKSHRINRTHPARGTT